VVKLHTLNNKRRRKEYLENETSIVESIASGFLSELARFGGLCMYTMKPSSDRHETMLSGPENQVLLCGLQFIIHAAKHRIRLHRALPGRQPPISPVGFLLLKLRHRLVVVT